MSLIAKKDHSVAIAPAVHLEFIQNQAGLPEGEVLKEIEEYHRALFLHHHAGELERFQQEARIHEDRLAHLDARLRDIHTNLAGIDKLVPAMVDGESDIQPGAPWNWWDRLMFAGSLMGIAVLLLFGVFNISFNLLESGLVTFLENPIRAYFWAALLPVGALGVKIGWDVLQSSRKKQIYLWLCLCAGIAGVLVWVASYASVYPTLSKTINEHIQTLSVFDAAGGQAAPGAALASSGAKWVDVITVAAQAVAEIFLSAVLGMHLTMLFTRHRRVRLAGNPLFLQLDDERRELEENVARERLSLAEARGNENRLQNQLSALLAYAKSIFQKESALRRDQSHQKRQLLDQITEQLRSQFDSIENRGNGHATPTLALSRENGK